MKKKLISLLLVFVMSFALCAPALAADAGEERVVLGADLTTDQILTVYAQFGLIRGSVTELTVTNAEERSYLAGLVSESVIGTRSISCVYIKILDEGSGMTVSATNINWCTEDMYKSALLTAGIYDAEVKVGAPYAVSGTAALTGIYKAYEDITGTELDEDAKTAAASELVVTAELAEEIDEEDAVAIVNDLKLMLDETSDMTDDELQDEIEDIASDYGYTLDTELIDKLIELVRALEELDVSSLQDKVQEFRDSLGVVAAYAEEAATFGQKIVQFFRNVFTAIKNFFTGGGNDDDDSTVTTESDALVESEAFEPEEDTDTEGSAPVEEDTSPGDDTGTEVFPEDEEAEADTEGPDMPEVEAPVEEEDEVGSPDDISESDGSTDEEID